MLPARINNVFEVCSFDDIEILFHRTITHLLGRRLVGNGDRVFVVKIWTNALTRTNTNK